MKLLFIAFSCSPNSGSEDKSAWEICLESAKQHDVRVITKEGSRKSIEEYFRSHDSKNIEFYYVETPAFIKKLFNGFLFSARLYFFHKKALPIAKAIVEKEHIKIIHQITPIEFRSIGDYGSIPNVKFVCGPLGGGEYVPNCLWKYTKGHRMIEGIRSVMNYYSRLYYKVNGILNRCDYFLFANKETKDYLKIDGLIEPDVGIYNNVINQELIQKSFAREIKFLVAGRLIYRKGHRFLFDVIKMIETNKPYKVYILGDGPDKRNLKKICKENPKLIRHVEFLEKVPFAEMSKLYQKSDVLIFPSIRETGGNVFVEALSNGLPVITINRFGASVIVNNSIGWLYSGKTEEQMKTSLRDCILDCIEHPSLIQHKRENILPVLKKYTWERKVALFNTIYSEIVNK